MNRIRVGVLTAVVVMIGGTTANAAPHCYVSYGGVKPNKLYLYFPTAIDASYPELGVSIGYPPTSPAHPFDAGDLLSYQVLGHTTDDLRNAIYDVVADDYCEFNVEVIKTTSAPPPTFPNRNTVAVTTDDGSAIPTYGVAEFDADTDDATPVDFAYVYGGSYQTLNGGTGDVLNGTKSTLDRWARGIGGTAAHEAGHDYGLSHDDGLPLSSGEDELVHHLMAEGSTYTDEDRVGYRRHFSNWEYSILAANVGLSVQTIWNWDFVNPNADPATKLMMDILSTQDPLVVAGPYSGSGSPWINPTVSGNLGTQTFKGVTYNHFQVTWSMGQNWDGHILDGPGPMSGAIGTVDGGASFHVGTGFSGVDYTQPNPIIVSNVTLIDSSNTNLALHPRTIAFDTGTLNAANGTMSMQAMNVGGPPLELSDVRVKFLPRLLAIGAMVTGNTSLFDVRNLPYLAYGRARTVERGQSLDGGQVVRFPIARLRDKRHVVQKVTADDCARLLRSPDHDAAHCRPGITVSLFPATITYLTATVVDPHAKYWDIESGRYVEGPLTSHAYLQFVGRHPDLNENGVDDYIDILTKVSTDRKRRGVPDDAKVRR